MPSLIDVAEEEEQRTPLLHNHNAAASTDDIVPSSSSPSNGPDSSPLAAPTPNQRLHSLDVFRGLTVAVCTPPQLSISNF